MRLFSWLRTWAKKGIRQATIRKSTRPEVQLLEARELLAQYAMGEQTWIGAVNPANSTWYLRGSPTAGAPNAGSVPYGGPGWAPVSGDWIGRGTSGIGVVNTATETWYLRNEDSPGAPDITPFQYGAPGWIPVTGDWTNSGHTGIGVVDPTTETWYLKNTAGPGAPDFVFRYGAPGWLPVAGNWAGGSHPTGIGVIDPATETWYLRLNPSAGAPDIGPFRYGAPGWTPVVGDWNGEGRDLPGVFNPTTGTWYLATPNGVQQFAYGGPGWSPIALHMGTGPVISLDTNALTLTPGADGNTASGQLTITNNGPANSVLSYQISGSVPITANPATGQLSGGQSQVVQISISGLSTLAAGTYTGTLTVSDASGAAASQQIPFTVTVGTKSGGGMDSNAKSGGTDNIQGDQVTYSGEIGFSFSVYNLGYNNSIQSLASQATADGTMSLTMVRGDNNTWRLWSATATLHQNGPAWSKDTPVNMTDTYEWNYGFVAPDALSSLEGTQMVFVLAGDYAKADVGGPYQLVVAGQFSGGRFLGSVINPGQASNYVSGVNLGSTSMGYNYATVGAAWSVGVPRQNGVNLVAT